MRKMSPFFVLHALLLAVLSYDNECYALSASSTTRPQPSSGSSTSTTNRNRRNKILVLGGTGFLGQEIIHQATNRQIDVISTSTSGIDSTIALDLTSDSAQEQVAQLAKDCIGVISTVGSIGTSSDLLVNSATAAAAKGAKAAGVSYFVTLGNDARVRAVTQRVPFLRDYARGKVESERAVRESFGLNGCIVQPSFIYGGESYGISPPRVATPVGSLMEEVLGLYPIQALSKALPDALGAPLEPPVSVEMVAGACLNVALGICEGYDTLSSKDAIVMAATSHRPRSCIDEEECSLEEEEAIQSRRDAIKRLLTSPSSGGGSSSSSDDEEDHDPIALMEELESLRPRSTKPAFDPRLNARWDFVLSKSDLGTDLLKELKTDEGFTPLQLVYAVRDVYMKISDDQTLVEIVLKSKVLGQDVDVTLSTSLLPMSYDDRPDTDGTMFVEKFEGVKLGDIDLPIPQSWQRSRYLEIGYLDDDIMVARGNSGEPHFLLRGDA